MADKATSKKASKQVMDVARPGKTTPSSSSRPIIVGHKPMLKDPMMSNKAVVVTDSSNKDAGQAIAVTRSAKTIAPLVAAEKPAPKTKAKKAAAAIPPPAPIPAEPEAPQTPPAQTSTPEAEQPDTPADQPAETTPEEAAPPEASDEAAVDVVADQVKDKKQETQESEEAQKKQAELEKLIEQKKYYVPIGQVTHRRHTVWALALLFMLLLAVAAVLYAIDAELFDPGFDLPFDYIKK